MKQFAGSDDARPRDGAPRFTPCHFLIADDQWAKHRFGMRRLERERDAQEQANEAQFEADWEEADARFSREFSDANNGFRLCPLRACRRARRCASDELLCVDLLPAKCPHAAAQPRMDEIYAEIQQQRRDDAEAQAAEESADDVF